MIRSKSNILKVFWFILLVAAVPLLRMAGKVQPAASLPEHWKLPDSIGEWRGENIYYSTSPEVTRSFREGDILEPGVCPLSGAPLDVASPSERRVLPKDVEIRRRLYRKDDLERIVIMLVTGATREGIHRPEWCLTAQGYRTGNRRILTARDQKGDTFGIGVYPMLREDAPDHATPSKYFVYWFEGPDIRTPYNAMRILRMGWDRLRYGRVQRWGYFSIQITVPAGIFTPDAYLTEATGWLVKGMEDSVSTLAE